MTPDVDNSRGSLVIELIRPFSALSDIYMNLKT